MAAAEHAITISDESVAMELPSLPPNQGLEAIKDIVFGSVSGA
jgi:ornithine carrier protein